jgi:hypothetical protein
MKTQKRQRQKMRRRRSFPGSRRGSKSLHFAVIADYSFFGCRPSLAGLSLYSTHEACTLWPVSGSLVKSFCTKRIFSTLKEAHSYIAYLKDRNPNSLIPIPVLDKGQPDLFQEVLI